MAVLDIRQRSGFLFLAVMVGHILLISAQVNSRAAGVVGRIVVPSAHAAKVQLLVDRNAVAGALVERSRAQGVIVGRGDSRLQMEYVSDVADVMIGDMIVTSGIDGIYPKGFIIG